MMKQITPCLWFDRKAEEAVQFYSTVFRNFKVTDTQTYPDLPKEELHGAKSGEVVTIAFEINGQPFLALNGGPEFKFNEALSLMIPCENQAEIDEYFEKLSAVPESEVCGWVKDKYGLSWQIVPKDWLEIMAGPNREAYFSAMMKMKKLDIAKLKAAANSQKKAA